MGPNWYPHLIIHGASLMDRSDYYSLGSCNTSRYSVQPSPPGPVYILSILEAFARLVNPQASLKLSLGCPVYKQRFAYAFDGMPLQQQM